MSYSATAPSVASTIKTNYGPCTFYIFVRIIGTVQPLAHTRCLVLERATSGTEHLVDG